MRGAHALSRQGRSDNGRLLADNVASSANRDVKKSHYFCSDARLSGDAVPISHEALAVDELITQSTSRSSALRVALFW